MTEIVTDQVTDEAVEVDEVTVQDDSNNILSQAAAEVLFAFKEVIGDGQWLSISGAANGEDFVIAVAINDHARQVNEMLAERFNDANRNTDTESV